MPGKRFPEVWSGLLIVVALAVVCSLLVVGCGKKSAPPPPVAVTPTPPQPPATQPATSATGKPGSAPPSELSKLGEKAEDIYDVVKAKDWPKAKADFAEVEAGLTKVEKTAAAEDTEASQALRKAVTDLSRAIKSNEQQAAMAAGNQITSLVMRLEGKSRLPAPAAIGKLDYYGRELETWSLSKDTARLKATAGDLEKEWVSVKPEVLAKGGKEQAAAFDRLVTKLKAAQTPAEFSQLATPILDEVDNLEKVFTK
ncbi:MAG: hypothetical protein ABFE08_16970 [Armatimonadia bacterium]